LRARLGWVSLALGLGLPPAGWGQPIPARLGVVVLPEAGTAMITQTVQTVSLTVTNRELFANLAAWYRLETNTVPMADDGAPPDPVPADGTFTALLSVPAYPVTTNFTVRFTAVGQDLTITNETGELLPESWSTNVTVRTYNAVVRPANDHFADAIKLAPGGGISTGANVQATIEPAEPFHGEDPDVAASVWWTWSPTNAMRVVVDTAGSSFPPVLAVYTGSALANLKLVAASTNDVVHGLKANVVFDARAGVTYRIAVAGYDESGQGTIRLSVTAGDGPDTVAPLVNITQPPSEALFTTNLVRITGTAKDPDPGATGVSAVEVQLNDEPPVLANGTVTWNLSLTMPPGTNVIRAVAWDLAGNASRPSVVVVRYIPSLNDHFADALELTELSGTTTADTEFATREPGEPAHAGNEGEHSIWYWFQAPAGGTLELTTQGSTFDTLLAVYTGDAVSGLELVGANDDARPGSGYSDLTVTVQRGQVYRVAVDGFGGEYGIVSLRHIFTTVETYYSLTLLAGLGGTIEPAGGLYLEGSIQTVTALPARDFEFLGWQGSLNTLENPISLVMTQNYTLSATFRVISQTEGFESGGFSPQLPWGSAGAALWFVQSETAFAGQYAARSGSISDGAVSALFLQTQLIEGTGAFRVRVSSEAGWDGLEFYLNGSLLKRWSGEIGWENYQFHVPAGVNTLEWRYVKDANFSAGSDAAFLDNLYLPLPDAAVAARLSIAVLPDRGYQVAVQGYPGRAYLLEASSDLSTWTPVHTNSSPSGSWVWMDLVPPTRSARYYRALLQ